MGNKKSKKGRLPLTAKRKKHHFSIKRRIHSRARRLHGDKNQGTQHDPNDPSTTGPPVLAQPGSSGSSAPQLEISIQPGRSGWKLQVSSDPVRTPALSKEPDLDMAVEHEPVKPRKKDVSGQLSASGEDESSSSLLVKRKSIRPKKAPEVYRPQLPPPKKKWKREICCNCHVSIKVFRKLVRCVQCDTGAMLCGECMNRRHKHSQHTLLQMPNTKIYHVLQGIFQRLRQEVNDLLCPEEDDEEETPLPSEGEEPLVEEPSQPTPYLTLSAMQITQEHSTAQQFDPLNTVIKQEDPTEEDMVVVHETEMGPIDIEIHEVSVPSVIGYVQPEREPSFSTTARKRKANADRAGTSAQTLKRAAVERPESRTQAQNRGVLERIPGEAGVAITPSVAVVSSQFCEDIAIKLEPPPPDEQRPPDELPLPLDYAKEELGDGTHEPGSAIHNIYGTQTRDNT